MSDDTALPADETATDLARQILTEEALATGEFASINTTDDGAWNPWPIAVRAMLRFATLSRPSSSGRDEVLEEAARLFDDPDGGPSDCGNFGWCHNEGNCTRHGADIPTRIRALKSQPPSTGGGAFDRPTDPAPEIWDEWTTRPSAPRVMTEELQQLVKRLRRTHIAQGPNGGAFHERPVNPDGPRAADAILALCLGEGAQ